MKKKALLAITAAFALFCIQTNAQGLEKGYHGSVEAGYSVEVQGATLGFNWFELNSIHGYQATPNIFIGAGVGFHFFPEVKEGQLNKGYMWKRDSSVEKILFADLRWTILNKKISPIGDLRIGNNLSDGSGLYTSIGAGCRLAIKGNSGVSFMLSYSTHSNVKYNITEDGNTGITAKVGFEF